MSYFQHDSIVPDEKNDQNKKVQVANMFNEIAYRYDFLNRFLSFGIDVYWRKKALQYLNPSLENVLDVATGTGDVAIMIHDKLAPKKIIGIDISDGMLEIGRKKIEKKQLQKYITLLKGDSENIAFKDDHFNAITVAFGVRNFMHLEKGLTEMLRVLQPGGRIVILEFSKPTSIFIKPLYRFYMKVIAPFFGKLFAKNKKAYSYLNESVQAFPERENMLNIMRNCGFQQPGFKPLTFGICCIYTAVK